ncbi:MAG: DegV family protein [Collinsella aerofaciens]
MRDRVVVIGLLETLEYLVRGGRLSAAAGAVGTLLNVKPVVAAEDGLIVQLGKARGSKNGRNLLNQKVEKAGGIDFPCRWRSAIRAFRMRCSRSISRTARHCGLATPRANCYTIGATIGTHVGPVPWP